MSIPTSVFFLIIPPPPKSTLFPYTTLFRSKQCANWLGSEDGVENSRPGSIGHDDRRHRSEEHTSELQSHSDLVCRLLLEKKKKKVGKTKPRRTRCGSCR